MYFAWKPIGDSLATAFECHGYKVVTRLIVGGVMKDIDLKILDCFVEMLIFY